MMIESSTTLAEAATRAEAEAEAAAQAERLAYNRSCVALSYIRGDDPEAIKVATANYERTNQVWHKACYVTRVAERIAINARAAANR